MIIRGCHLYLYMLVLDTTQSILILNCGCLFFFFIFAFPSEVNGTEEKLISTQFERILASLWLKETFKIQFCDSVKFVS